MNKAKNYISIIILFFIIIIINFSSSSENIKPIDRSNIDKEAETVEEIENTEDSENSIIKKIDFDIIEAADAEDVLEEREGLYVFSPVNIRLNKYNIKKRKELFVKLLLPAIKVVQQEVLNNREIVAKLKEKEEYTEDEEKYLNELFKKYKVKYGDFKELESRLIIYPTSLILSQGAIESGWGTSRFFREANNIFGIWAFSKNIPHILAKRSRNNFTARIRKFGSLKESVEYLTILISTSNNYKNIRELILKEEKPYAISSGLKNYSESKQYVSKVRNMLLKNKFEKYDEIIPYIVK